MLWAFISNVAVVYSYPEKVQNAKSYKNELKEASEIIANCNKIKMHAVIKTPSQRYYILNILNYECDIASKNNDMLKQRKHCKQLEVTYTVQSVISVLSVSQIPVQMYMINNKVKWMVDSVFWCYWSNNLGISL